MEQMQNLSSEVDVRRAKIQNLRTMGEIPYKAKFERTCTIAEAREKIGQRVKVAGRVVFKRVMGKFGFMQIRDIFSKIQISVGRNELNEEDYDFYKKMVDIADFVGVEGEVYTTQTGEVTVKAEKVTLLSKTLRPLPEKFHGLTDTETKYRQRYLDLVMNEDARAVFIARSKVVSFIRRFLEDNGFVEGETPILQTNVSGASAKPFYTHHNALDMECNLRIAKETWLKQCIGAGFDRVFELGKDFRNEGMDTTHLQEFTQVEWYASYWDFEDIPCCSLRSVPNDREILSPVLSHKPDNQAPRPPVFAEIELLFECSIQHLFEFGKAKFLPRAGIFLRLGLPSGEK